jgi:bilirubin oxidase
VQLTRLRLAPGERAEILVDLTGLNGQIVNLMSYASDFGNGIYGATNPGMNASMTLNGYKPNALNGADFQLLALNVGAQTSSPVTSIPLALVMVTPIDSTTSNLTRKLVFSPETGGRNQLNGNFFINDVLFDIDVINYTVPFNNIEIWEIDNNTAIAHPFHIHDVQFYILERNGVVPPVNEQGRKDVLLVKPQEVIKFIAKFETFSNSSVPYMYHCHMLVHEDGGMMGQFVVDNPLSVRNIELESKLNVYPNPATDEVTIMGEFNEVAIVKVYNSKGTLMKEFTADGEMKLIIKNWSQGMYYLIYTIEGEVITKTFVVAK